MTADNPRLPIELTLEESGFLCHALMRAMMDANNLQERVPANAQEARVIMLYMKLSDLNDALMKKET